MKYLVLISLLFLVSCDMRPPEAPSEPVTPYVKPESEAFKKGKRQLQVMGYKNIEETSVDLWCLDENDSWLLSSGFKAQDAEGESVEGCICVKGLLSSSVTIRFK